MKIKDVRLSAYNITPVDKPDIVSEPGAVHDLADDAELARSLLEQPTNYVPVDAEAVALLDEMTAAPAAVKAFQQAGRRKKKDDDQPDGGSADKQEA